MSNAYHPATVEESAQAYWEKNDCFSAKEDLSKEKFYSLCMLPYPSGDLHMGHVRNYTIGDVIARYHRQLGRNVLQPMGWDAFGLPAENAAIAHHIPPAEWTEKNIKKMRTQLKQLGFAYDWERELSTCHPEYYRWEQWLFVKLFKKGLAYKKNSVVNWDPVDHTVLANEQVVDGKGWRSGAPVERREISQWFLRITDYAEELLNDLDTLTDWPLQVKTMQRHWIGRSEGVLINFQIPTAEEKITVFTTRPDTLMGVTYIAIAAEHPLAKAQAKKSKKIASFIKKCQQVKVAEADIATQEKIGIDSGLQAIHPLTQKPLPIWIANFVLMEYGAGGVMAVPAHDERDHEFALQYGLPIQPVIAPADGTEWGYETRAYTGRGTLVNSAQFDGLDTEQAFDVIADYLLSHGIGQQKTHYRLRDWGISRQRYWGTPIPIIYCKQCGPVPVAEKDLPVILPTHLIPQGHGSPLETDAEFYKTTCPSCGKAARRETDTMDTFVESSWYYARYCCKDQDQAMLDDRAKYWTPVDQYVGGIEHAVMHLLYARFMHKLLRDLGLLNSKEPFLRLLTQGMVLKDGAKMSKSKGNIVAPQALIKKYGADTVRLFMMFAAPPEHDLEWSDEGVEGAFRFLKKLWSFAETQKQALQALNRSHDKILYDSHDAHYQRQRHLLHTLLDQAIHDFKRSQFNTVVSASMKILNLLIKSEETHPNPIFIHEGLSSLLRLLAPITPHLCHELWRELAFGDNILEAGFVKTDNKALQSSQVEMVVQVNGKLRAKLLVPADTSNESIEKMALAEDNVRKFIANHKIKKVIIVPKKLVNIVM